MHAGIVHRDLKLSNILLTGGGALRIADFGFAVQLGGGGTDSATTFCGTPNFISPEVVAHAPYGRAADLWSLGCLLYGMLTGKPPFECQTVEATLAKVSLARYELPTSMSEAARDLVSRLLRKDAEERIGLPEVTNARARPLGPPPPPATLPAGPDCCPGAGFWMTHAVAGLGATVLHRCCSIGSSPATTGQLGPPHRPGLGLGFTQRKRPCLLRRRTVVTACHGATTHLCTVGCSGIRRQLGVRTAQSQSSGTQGSSRSRRCRRRWRRRRRRRREREVCR
jgi:hypothetical protein